MIEKERIFYTRTYRKMQFKKKDCLIFIGVVVIPVLFLYLYFMENLMNGVVQTAGKVLAHSIGDAYCQIRTTNYAKFWNIKYLELPTTYPSKKITCINFVFCVLFWGMEKGIRKKKNPISIFMFYGMLVHLSACVYSFFKPDSFPYTTGEYSELYIKQQLGIWLMFLLMAGLVLGSVGHSLFQYRILAFGGICVYSLVFGVIRYIFFLFCLYRFSVLYMAVMFFVAGPMVDFIYFVMIYAVFMNKLTKEYEKGNRRGEWVWS